MQALTAHQNTSSGISALHLRTKSRVRCCIHGCNNREGDDGFSFHRFPTDPFMRSQWVEAINQRGFFPSQSTRICSRHFTRHSFVAKPESVARHPASRRRLYPNAIPSLFSSASYVDNQHPIQKAVGVAVPSRGISLISESRDAARRATCGNAIPQSSPAVPAPAPSRQEFALLGQIVRVALDVDEAQARLLRELGRLGRKQRCQEALLGHLLDQLTRLVDPPDTTPPPPVVKSDEDLPDDCFA